MIFIRTPNPTNTKQCALEGLRSHSEDHGACILSPWIPEHSLDLTGTVFQLHLEGIGQLILQVQNSQIKRYDL